MTDPEKQRKWPPEMICASIFVGGLLMIGLGTVGKWASNKGLEAGKASVTKAQTSDQLQAQIEAAQPTLIANKPAAEEVAEEPAEPEVPAEPEKLTPMAKSPNCSLYSYYDGSRTVYLVETRTPEFRCDITVGSQ